MNIKHTKSLTFLLGLLAFLVNGDNYAASPVLINIAKDFSISIDTAALSVTSYMLFFGFLTIIMGPLGDRFGKPLIILFSALGTSLFSIICAFSTSIQNLIILRALNGAFASGILPVSVALIGEITPQNEKQNAIGKIMSMMFLGGAIATSIGGSLAFFGSWKLVYLVYGIAELILTGFAFQFLNRINTSKTKGNIFLLYKQALFNKSLLKIMLLLFLMGYCILGSFVYTGKLVENKTGQNVLIIGLILSFFGIGTVIAGRKSGNIRAGIGKIFFIICGLTGGTSILYLVTSISLISISVSLFIFGVVFITLQSTFVTTAQNILPNIRGTIMSLASFSVVMGGSLGTYINGKLFSSVGINKIFILTAILLALTAVLAHYFIKQLSSSINTSNKKSWIKNTIIFYTNIISIFQKNLK